LKLIQSKGKTHLQSKSKIKKRKYMSSHTPKKHPRLLTRGDTTPPCETTRHRHTTPTKLTPERAACPLAPGRGAPILPSSNKDEEFWRLSRIYKIGNRQEHPMRVPKVPRDRIRICPPMTTEQDWEVPELNDDSPQKVVTQRATVTKTETVKSFHPKRRSYYYTPIGVSWPKEILQNLF
jgi:hypothetical protein